METCWDIKDVDRRNWCFANQMANAWKMKDSNPNEVDPDWGPIVNYPYQGRADQPLSITAPVLNTA